MTDLAITPLDPRAYALLAQEGFGAELFNPTQHRACELVDAYATELAIDLCRRLGLDDLLDARRTVEELRAARGFDPRVAPALAWVLDRLAGAGWLDERDGAYARRAPLPVPRLDAIRSQGLATEPTYLPAYELLDAAAAACPLVASGQTTGERALLGKITLWVRYFANAHAYYALNNRVAAAAAAARLGAGAAVLEVGAGLGSATEALLEALAARGTLGTLGSYRATEPVAFFSRRAERSLASGFPNAPLAFAALDINQPWASQGIGAGAHDLVWGVNVFHLARDLDGVLAEARAALAPGGWLVVGEGMRPLGQRAVGAELPFRLLESFTDVRLDAERRPNAGFLTPEDWQRAIARAGFAETRLVPDVIRLRAHYPGLLAAAVCARRP